MKNKFNKLITEIKKEFFFLIKKKKPKKIIFDHIPKCGGSSLNAYLELHYLRRKTFSIKATSIKKDIDKFKKYPRNKRYQYNLIKGHLAHELFAYIASDTIKITVLRNPVERIISHYYYAKSKKKHYLYKLINEKNISIEDYVKNKLSQETDNWYVSHFSKMTKEEIELNPKDAINKAYEFIINQYDLVGFLDNFTEFTDRLYKFANLNKKYTGNKENITRNKPRYNEIGENIIKIISRINMLDIELYEKIQLYYQDK